MGTKQRLQSLVVLMLALSLLSSGCSAAGPASSSARQTKLKIAALRILDALPLYVAQQEGYFQKHGVNVELIPVGSAPERDQLVAAGQADGMINEIVGALFFNKDKVQVQIVRFARAATKDTHLFSVLASKKSGIQSTAGLKGASIGISDGTVIAYLTDRMLQKEGFSAADINTVSVPNLSDRMTLLNSGEIQAAMLPEPMSTLAIQQGAKLILDDSKYPNFSNSMISMRKQVIDQNPDEVRAFLAAVEDAVKAINANPTKYETLLSDLKLVPTPLKGTFKVPPFVTAGVPDEAQFKDVLDWAKSKKLIQKDISYQDCVNASFLP
jgi:NitT/TauT family transport system substrate-binding protein